MAFHVSEACEALNISRSTFTKLAAAGTIRTVRLGGRVLCPASEIARILNGEART
jgi:excisionase family DNA binding protein